MDDDDDDGDGGAPGGGAADGVGDGDVEEVEESPHATANSKTADTTARRNEIIRPSDVPNLRPFSNIPDEWNGAGSAGNGVRVTSKAAGLWALRRVEAGPV